METKAIVMKLVANKSPAPMLTWATGASEDPTPNRTKSSGEITSPIPATHNGGTKATERATPAIAAEARVRVNAKEPAAPAPRETNKIPIIASFVDTRIGEVKSPTAQVKITNDITLGFISLNNSEKLNKSS